MKKLAIDFLGTSFKNPIITASGTYQTSAFTPFMDIGKLGGVTLKGVAKEPWKGNATPRIAEVPRGMLNAVGLQNPGVQALIKGELTELESKDTRVIVNIAGKQTKDYCEVAKELRGQPLDFIELNISCPNVKEGGVAFGTNSNAAYAITKAVKEVSEQPLIVKLSPNVANIKEIASAVEEAGADAVSLINTLIGMSIDVRTGKPVLANKRGGLSGPAIKPVALRMIYDVYEAVNIPIIGMGGVMTGEDALEFIMAGASLVAIGTANLLDPLASLRILNEMESLMETHKIKDIESIVGIAH